MILGIGTDITDIERIKGSIERFGARFIKRCFSEAEQNHAYSKSNKTQQYSSFAKSFAAKEACAKALGLGIRAGIQFKDFQVTRNSVGAPSVMLTGKAEEYLNEKAQGHDTQIHLSLTDEYPYAQAFVIIERDR